MGIVAISSIAGLVVRLLMIFLSPRWGYYHDHDDLARWGLQCVEQGILTIYDRPPAPAELSLWTDQGWAIARRDMDRLCNYPPLCVYLLAGSGAVFKATSPDRIINTIYSRASIGLWSVLFDFVLAAGCAKLVSHYRPGRYGLWAYVVCILAPPFWLVSCLWGQVDTWVLAPAVWMLWAMVVNRWLVAGVLFGVTAAMKPQAAAMLPVWALALVTIRPYTKVLRGGLMAGVTFFLLAIPFSLHGGAAWWKESYQANLFEHSKGFTTLMAFNIWYLDVLLTGSVDEKMRWFGITKAGWGQIGLGLALIAGFGKMVRQWTGDSRGLIVWTALVMIAFISIPTRVHDRFILLILPFLLVCAFMWRGVWPGFVVLVVVATGQVSWPQWLTAASVDWEPFEKEMRVTYEAKVLQLPPAERAVQPPIDEFLRHARAEFDVRVSRAKPVEWTLTLLGLVGTLLAVTGLLRITS
ncbi:MAG: glycosyltransferase 87 family protein [Planctomycetota bacterium]